MRLKAWTTLPMAGIIVGTTLLLSSAAATWAAPVAISYAGMVAPGTGGKTFYPRTLPYTPVANGDSVVFAAQTTDFKYGLWRWQNGTLSKIIYSGDPIPGVPGETFSSSSEFTVNDQGRAAFSTFYALTIETGSGLVSVAKKGAPAPGSPGTFYTFDDLAFAANGEVSFRAQVSGGGSGFGIWRATTTSVTPVAVDGQSISGGKTITSTYSFAPPAAGNGSTTFEGTVAPGSLGAIIRQTGSSAPQILALVGEHAPGLGTETYNYFSDVAGNDAGQLAYRAGLSDGSVYNAIFRDMGSGPYFAVGNGSSMPGPAGAKLAGLNDPIINEAGIVAFSGYLSNVPSGSGTSGIWAIDVAGGIREVVREKNSVPGLAGVQFGGFIGAEFQMNDSNQIAFLASLSGTGINSNNNTGLWATNPAGQLVQVVREGDVVQVTPGVFRTVRSIEFSGSTQSNGAPSVWTDSRVLLYTLNFTDSTSGIFVSAVPEPSGLILAGAGLMSVLGWRMRRRVFPA